MPSTGFSNGPFLLTAEGIEATATKTAPGAEMARAKHFGSRWSFRP